MAEDPKNSKNQRKQEQESSQASQDLGKMLNEQKDLNKEGAVFLTIYQEIAKYQRQTAEAAIEANKNTKDANDYASKQRFQQKIIAERTKDSVSLAKKLSSFSREDLKSKAKKAAFDSTYKKALDSQALLIAETLEISEKAKKLPDGTDEQKKLKELELDKASALEAQVDSQRDLLQSAAKLKRSYTDLGNFQKPFEGIEKIVSSIPVVREVFGELTKMSQKIADAYVETGNVGKSIGAGFEQLGKGILKLTLGALLTGLIRGFSKLSDTIAKVQTGLALSVNQAKKLSSTLTGLQSSFFNLEELEKAAVGFGAALGSSTVTAGSTIEKVAILAERLGISADESAKIFTTSTDTLMSFDRQTNIIAGNVKKLNEQYKISIRLTDVFKDIAGVSAQVALYFKDYPGQLAKAAFETRRLGLNLNQLTGVQDSVLDFQSSLQKELQAEAQLGIEIEMDDLRYYSFKKDYLKMGNEISRILEDIEKKTGQTFAEMNPFDQEATAGLLNMTTEVFSEMILKREALLKLSKEEQAIAFDNLTTEQKIKKLSDLYRKKDITLSIDDAQIKALEALQLDEEKKGAEILLAQKNALGAMNKLSKTLEMFGTKLAELFMRLTGIDNPLDKIANGISKMTGYLFKILQKFGHDPGLKSFGGGSEAAALAIANKAEAGIRGVNDINSEEIKLLQKLADEKITDNASAGKKEQIQLAKKALESINKIGGIDIAKLQSSILKAGQDISGPFVTELFKETVEKQRSEAGSVLEALEFLKKNFNFKEELTFTPLDIQKGLAREGDDTILPVNDFIIKTHPKDTLVMAGGTKLGSDNVKTNQLLEKLIDTVNNTETNKLLQVLVDTVRKGGNVYLDSRKVGESLVLGYSSQ